MVQIQHSGKVQGVLPGCLCVSHCCRLSLSSAYFCFIPPETHFRRLSQEPRWKIKPLGAMPRRLCSFLWFV